jgi:hypothetical protein
MWCLAKARWTLAAAGGAALLGVVASLANGQVAAPIAEPKPAAKIDVAANPARIEAAPGGLSDPISITVTNGGPLPTSISLSVQGVLAWSSTKSQTTELTPGGSAMITIFLRAPGLAGPANDNIVIEAHADGDNSIRGQATVTAARRACLGDWDGIEGLTPQDVSAFLGDLFRQTADFDGVNGTDASDLYQFLDVFFAGCK